MRPATVLICAALISSGPAAAFAPENARKLSASARWAAESFEGTGLHDDIQVGVAPDFERDLGVTPEQIPVLRDAVRAAFAAWESPVLRFEVEFDAEDVEQGTRPGRGYEIDVFAVHEGHPKFQGDATVFAITPIKTRSLDRRLLTNGGRANGALIVGADIFINIDRVAFFRGFLGGDEVLESAALQRLLMHQIGHALGLLHPSDAKNLDDDRDPSTPLAIDPCDPFVGLSSSTPFDGDAVMVPLPADPDALFRTSLSDDDLAGRDVLYPAPSEEMACVCAPFCSDLGGREVLDLGLAALGSRALDVSVELFTPRRFEGMFGNASIAGTWKPSNDGAGRDGRKLRLVLDDASRDAVIASFEGLASSATGVTDLELRKTPKVKLKINPEKHATWRIKIPVNGRTPEGELVEGMYRVWARGELDRGAP